MSLFQLGDFKLHSNQQSAFKIDCDALSEADLECLCYLLSKRLPAFGSVEGVPTGGIRIANEMVKYCTAGPLLIVDDVFTTGNSMEEHRQGREAIGAVLFARAATQSWITPLFTMSKEL